MIRAFRMEGDRLEGPLDTPEDALWLDLLEPSRDEEATVERLIGVNVPTRDDMEEIEVSSRLYLEDGTVYMTAIVPARTEDDEPHMAPISFVLTPHQLVTVRYHEPRAFAAFPPRAHRTRMDFPDAATLLVSLLEAVVDRLADILERIVGEIDTISRAVFRRDATQGRDFQKILDEIGRKGDLTSKMRDSLLTLDRLSGFLAHVARQRKLSGDLRERIKTLSRDVRSLLDHADYMSQKVTFLLDATLGMINIEQNAIIKIFSVAAVIFLPPTLIASIYGMNFEHMPELGWRWGYPAVIGLMLASAAGTYLFFRRRGWL